MLRLICLQRISSTRTVSWRSHNSFKSPLLLAWPWTPASLGNLDNPSYIPILFAQSSNKMSFFERFSSTFWYSFHHVHHPLPMNAPSRRIPKQCFGESLPALSFLARNTTLILVNNHFTSNGPRPLVPGVIEVAGIHFKPTKKLP